MTATKLAIILLAACALTAGCSGRGDEPVDEVSIQQTYSLTSPSFPEGAPMPLEHATENAGGRNLSPALEWTGAPKETESYAIECVDLAPVANNWVHWLVVNVPASEGGIAEGASGSTMPPGAVELENGFGRQGWGGPQPPRGTGAHEYRFTIYALDTPSVDITEDASLGEFREAIRPHVLAKGTLSGTYQR